MEFIRHRWKMILLMALLTAAVLGGAMLFWSSTKEKTYTGGLFVKEESQKEDMRYESQSTKCRESTCGFLTAGKE